MLSTEEKNKAKLHLEIKIALLICLSSPSIKYKRYRTLIVDNVTEELYDEDELYVDSMSDLRSHFHNVRQSLKKDVSEVRFYRSRISQKDIIECHRQNFNYDEEKLKAFKNKYLFRHSFNHQFYIDLWDLYLDVDKKELITFAAYFGLHRNFILAMIPDTKLPQNFK